MNTSHQTLQISIDVYDFRKKKTFEYKNGLLRAQILQQSTGV